MRSSSPVEQSLPYNVSPDAEKIISEQSSWSFRLSELYSDNLIAKVLRTAAVYLENNVSLHYYDGYFETSRNNTHSNEGNTKSIPRNCASNRDQSGEMGVSGD
jgi:hypothetical protein